MKIIYLVLAVFVFGACQSTTKVGTFLNTQQDDVETAAIDSEDSMSDTPSQEREVSPQKESETVLQNFDTPTIIETHLVQKDTKAQESTLSTSPSEQVSQANVESLQEPSTYIIQNSLVMYNYQPHFIYKVYTSPQRVTVIKLEPGESIIGELVSGDTANWIIATSEDKHSNIVYIKPVRFNVSTNLIINTSERTYNLILKSLPETYMVSVEWRYPMKEIQKKEREKHVLEIPVSLENLYFGYKIVSVRKDPVWKPIKIFDDGTRTFMQFKNKLDISESPALFATDDRGRVVLVNYRVIEDYYVVDRILQRAELRVGNKKRDVIKIVRLKKN